MDGKIIKGIYNNEVHNGMVTALVLKIQSEVFITS